MSIGKQLLIGMILCGFTFLVIRNILWGIKELYLSKNERKKRRKGQTFKEWFLYSRYRKEIPKALIWLYFAILIIHPLLLICISLAFLIEFFRNITFALTIAVVVFDAFWLILIFILSWKPGSPWVHYERWITKKRRNQKK